MFQLLMSLAFCLLFQQVKAQVPMVETALCAVLFLAPAISRRKSEVQEVEARPACSRRFQRFVDTCFYRCVYGSIAIGPALEQ